jgi:Arylsulfotransferase (ASST)/Transmembrane protein 131-like N-terminal
MASATRIHHLARGLLLRALPAGAVLFLLTTPSRAALPPGYLYVSPMPGARYVSPHNNVVVRGSSLLDQGALDPTTVSLVGSMSGAHRGALTLADDGRTLVFVPDESFQLGERVTVTLASGLRTTNGEHLPPLSFDFFVGAVDPRLQGRRLREVDARDAKAEQVGTPANATPVAVAIDTLPASYPPIVVIRSNNPEPGHLFMTPNPPGQPVAGNLVIMDNLGQPLFYRRMPNRTTDLNKHDNGRLSFFHDATFRYYLLDARYTVVDSFETGNGYLTDNHELQLMPNGHALMMAYDDQPVRMDSVIAGGNPNAIVTGLIIQEVDAAKNVVFQWRSWDHMNILDVNSCVEDVYSANIDYVHGNSIELDNDGHLLISSRHLNEITKINRQTGAIMWRLGRNALRNQFTFVNDPRGFSHQHDARRLPNGRLSIFDNGNCLDTLYSRALEYQLDEVNNVATLVWQYRDAPDTYGRATGSLQRRAGGGTLIDWGFGLKVTDLHPNDSKAFEVLFSVLNMQTYRAYRYPWTTTQFSLDAELLDFGSVAIGDSATLELTVHNTWNRTIEIDRFVSTEARFRVLDAMPLAIPPAGSATVDVVFKAEATGPVHGMLYARAVNDTELVAQRVELRGAGPTSSVHDPADGLAFAVHPSPSSGRTFVAFSLPREDHVLIRMLDVQGRLLEVLADGRFPAGRHEVEWDAGRMAPGLYFASFEGGGRTMMRRTVVVH